MANKWVYLFSERNTGMRNTLGGKGANLAEMTGLGLPVPQGFTVTTEACTQYYEDGEVIRDEIIDQIMDSISKLEEIVPTGLQLPSGLGATDLYRSRRALLETARGRNLAG